MKTLLLLFLLLSTSICVNTANTNYKLRTFRNFSNSPKLDYSSFTRMLQDTLSLEDDLSEDDIQIYPNPTTDWHYVSLILPINTIELYDTLEKKNIETSEATKSDYPI